VNDVVDALVRSVGEACVRHPTVPTGPLGPRADEPSWNSALWSALEKIGILLLPVPEDRGGAGGDLATTVAVLDVLGAHAATVPYVETALLAGWLLSESDAPIPSGPMTAALVGGQLNIEKDANGMVLTGRIRRVPWARCVEHVVLLADRDVVLLGPDDYVVQCSANLAGEPRDALQFSNARIGSSQVRSLVVDSVVDEKMFVARAALGRVAMLAGAARRAFELSVGYASERQQFGRSIDKFQAVQQHLAAMAAEVLICRISAGAAAAAVDDVTDDKGHAGASVAVAAAAVAVASAAGVVARTAHQVHGAIGFTEEHDLHLSTTRIWSWRDECGGARVWSDLLGSCLIEAGPDGIWPLLTTGAAG